MKFTIKSRSMVVKNRYNIAKFMNRYCLLNIGVY